MSIAAFPSVNLFSIFIPFSDNFPVTQSNGFQKEISPLPFDVKIVDDLRERGIGQIGRFIIRRDCYPAYME
jgi:hypothetical protein